MNKVEYLDKAKELITKSRNETHGDASSQLNNTARLWTSYLGEEITAEQVAICMVLMKISRSTFGQRNPDDYVGMLGYGAIAGELSQYGDRISVSIPVDAEDIEQMNAAPGAVTVSPPSICTSCGSSSNDGKLVTVDAPEWGIYKTDWVCYSCIRKISLE